MKRRYMLSSEELIALLTNGRWFAGFKARWKPVGERYEVTTNYDFTPHL
jgi:hypothetical protein